MTAEPVTPSRILWYFADPMCSWCWGFAPVISAIRQAYADRLKVALLLGGLRPGTTEPMSAALRAEILHHWHEVHRRTGQPFAFEGAMPAGFVYDTEPPSRAVVAVAGINPEETFPYFKSVQAAFYAHRQDVTQTQTLAELAEAHHIAAPQFLEQFHSAEAEAKTRMHFQQTQEAGVRGFPTALLQDAVGSTLLTRGYRSFEELQPEIEAWLARPA
ncbi:MAG TPA: DsbA family protein [Acidiferrobacterales bacterium]|nr:DsbA family protein [Acidiferrobacterales bacterium]